MPQQEVFFAQKIGERSVEVLRTYDAAFAREAFGNMDANARALLWKSLRIDDHEQGDSPLIESGGGDDLLWDALLEDSREDGNLLSFFVVTEAKGKTQKSLYASSDRPSAKTYAQNLLGQLQSH
jgi:hypothetical protein